MGVIYKLRDEVVQFIINERKTNPLFSCRQLAESASQKFGLHLSKSSVHDVLKDSGIITPRGRKPKDKFQIPQGKKKQIQESLAQVKLLTSPEIPDIKLIANEGEGQVGEKLLIEQKNPVIPGEEPVILSQKAVVPSEIPVDVIPIEEPIVSGEIPAPPAEEPAVLKEETAMPIEEPVLPSETPVVTDEKPQEILDISVSNDSEKSLEYEGAGKIFLKAALWDLGIYSEEGIKEQDWIYYLTYAKGIKVVLEDNRDFFIDLPLPIERCIRELADGLINNIRPLVVDKVSDGDLFKACMEAQEGYKIESVSIVEQKDRFLLELNNIVVIERNFTSENRVFVENKEKMPQERLKSVFFPQVVDNNGIIDEIINLNGFDITSKHDFMVNLLINDKFAYKDTLEQAAEKLNGMCLYDDQNRRVRVKIQG